MNTKFTRIHHQLHFELFSSSIVISLPRQCRLNFMLNFRGAVGGSWITFHRENNSCFYIPLFNHIFCGLVGGAYIFCEQSSGIRRVRVRMSASVGGWVHAYVRACVRACERVLVPVCACKISSLLHFATVSSHHGISRQKENLRPTQLLLAIICQPATTIFFNPFSISTIG